MASVKGEQERAEEEGVGAKGDRRVHFQPKGALQGQLGGLESERHSGQEERPQLDPEIEAQSGAPAGSAAAPWALDDATEQLPEPDDTVATEVLQQPDGGG